MATVSERARELRARIVGAFDDKGLNVAIVHEVIEQALLAECRLAMEEAAKMCMEGYGNESNTLTEHYRRSKSIAAKLRARRGEGIEMKTVFAILFLCSVAVSQDAAVNQSSQPITVEQANILLQMRESAVHSIGMSEVGKKAHDQTVNDLLSQFWHENCDHPVNASMAKACGQTTAEPTAVKPKAGAVPAPCGSSDSEKTKKHQGEASR